MNIRPILAILILLLQVGAVAYARFVPAKYFCWAPYDSINLYRLEVLVGGELLSPDEIYNRYRLPQAGRDNRNIQHVKDILQQVEETYEQENPANVTMQYTVNGHPEEEWRWPR